MRQDIHDAIDSACTVESGSDDVVARRTGKLRYRSAQATRAIVLSVLQELAQDMTVGELVEELQIAENQAPG